MPVYFFRSQEIRDSRLEITGSLAHHLRDVLRVRPGERLHLVDEDEKGHVGEVESIDRSVLFVRLVEPLPRPPFSRLSITLGQALLKGDKMDWVIQKGTELGVSRIVPLISRRTVVRARRGKEAGHQERWQRIALEAAQQSGRWNIPQVKPPEDLSAWVQAAPKDAVRLILWEKESAGKGRTVFEERPPDVPVVALVGPEGGFEVEEVNEGVGAGFLPVSLGPRTLRAETASLTLLALLQHRWGDLG
jgi:16S rRNA (uracil1498-N3)-methyltransferase